ncbi:hypothetical protein E2C01_016849 [Portunus trituberculatus]|uniref:Uncharacterized protein n=1 Tax=Portunus trituberculatus TaxID=210409 RepID=A0A5B7DS95_PORTR|nr:hypothetical protein [Portunus trituberculatus]
MVPRGLCVPYPPALLQESDGVVGVEGNVLLLVNNKLILNKCVKRLTPFRTASKMAWYAPASMATPTTTDRDARTSSVTWQHVHGDRGLSCPQSAEAPTWPGRATDTSKTFHRV